MTTIQAGSTRGQQQKQIKDDPRVQALMNKTPVEVYQWVDTNVTDLASAKNLLQVLAAAMAWLLQNR
jgi:hypothetical protein